MSNPDEAAEDYNAGLVYYTTHNSIPTIALKPRFFSHYYDGSHKFQNSFIYLGACNGLAGTSLAETLLNSGAKCVVGYTGKVSFGYEKQKGDALLDSILKGTSVKDFFDGKVVESTEDSFYPGTRLARVGNYTWSNNGNPAPDDNFAGGDGSINNPYQIATARQLDAVRNHLDSNFVLVDDIDLSEYENWEPIGGYIDVEAGDGLQGSFDGQGHTISNLKMDYAIQDVENTHAYYLGLFSDTTLSPGIKNVNLENVNINISGSGDYNITGSSTNIYVAGFSVRASILSNINTSGTITTRLLYSNLLNVGGISYTANRIVNSTNDIDIHVDMNSSQPFGSFALAGIMTLGNSSQVYNCSNLGNIFARSSIDRSSMRIAGIIATDSNSTISNCINYGNLEGSCYEDVRLGGIVSYGWQTDILTCANYGRLSARTYDQTGTTDGTYVSGIIAYGNASDNNHLIVKNCANFGNLISFATTDNRDSMPNAYCAGIIVEPGLYYVELSKCYNLGEEFEAQCRNQEKEDKPEMGRIAAKSYDGVLSDCYSIDSTLMNGLPATEDIGPDQKNGGSMSRAEIEKAVTDLGFELPA